MAKNVVFLEGQKISKIELLEDIKTLDADTLIFRIDANDPIFRIHIQIVSDK